MDIQKSSSTNFPVLDPQVSRNSTRDTITAYRGKKENDYILNISILLANGSPYESIGAYIAYADCITHKTNDEKVRKSALNWYMRAYAIEKQYTKTTTSFYKIVELHCRIFSEKSLLLGIINASSYRNDNPESFYIALAMTYGLYGDFSAFNNVLHEIGLLNLDFEKILSHFIQELKQGVKYLNIKVSPEQIDPLIELMESKAPHHRGILVYRRFFQSAYDNKAYLLAPKNKPSEKRTWQSPRHNAPEPIKPMYGPTINKEFSGNLENDLKTVEETQDLEKVFQWYRGLIIKANAIEAIIIESSIVRNQLLLANLRIRYFLLMCLSRVTRDKKKEEIAWKKLARVDIKNRDYYEYELLRIYIKFKNSEGILSSLKFLNYFKDSRLGCGVIFQCVLNLIKLGIKESVGEITQNMQEGPEKEMLLLIRKVYSESVNQKKLQHVITFINRTDIVFTVPVAAELIHLCSGFLSQEHPIYQSILENYKQLSERTLAATTKKEPIDILEESPIVQPYSIWNDIYKPRPINNLAKEVASPGWDE